ncbi:zinc-binding dehydrogenase [Streptomyces sp. MI02-7b]|uniref:zinc-binding dehydrogenase n=1 Tax=Streptomyces sp. MI02-7b TaxID=462941 RepID=UPI0029A10E02|nr:zinc-binding dehydrogenase [Streptomyces sp. MI02-7b]MDX3076544.1 zinc-binding dehydrogenase [Streptomyces sp. MI02-7b]
MHAIVLHAFGPAANLRYETTEDPEPGPGQVRIAVAAAGVHMIDTALRSGDFDGPYPLPALPTVPGREVAGTVDGVGEGVGREWLGRRVVAHLGMVPGGYAERAVTSVGTPHVLPDGLGFAEAVAMVGTGRTAMGILRQAPVGPADVAVVTAAAGGIGTLLVQAARNAGATVLGLAGGPAKAARVRELGADAAVDYTADGWTAAARAALDGRAATVVFDAVSGDLGRGAVDLLGRGGRHVVYGWASGGALDLSDEERAVRGITSAVVLGPAMARAGGPGGLRALEEAALAEAAAGRLRPAVHRFPLADAAAAHTALESRGTAGKVVLIP